MKVGRNDPCPCGSGKKYKKCCLQKETPDFRDLDYRRLSKAYNHLVDRLIGLMPRIFGPDAISVALDEFFLWPDLGDEPSDETVERNSPVFTPWLLFHWENRLGIADEPLPGPEGRTVAELYAEEKGDRLDPLERSLIASLNRKPFTFLEILRVDPGRGLKVRDVLTGADTEVRERSATEYVQAGDLMYGIAEEVNDVGMLVGAGTTLIPPSQKPRVIQFRKRLREEAPVVTGDMLWDLQGEIREFYLRFEEALHTLPQICNTDGDLLEFHRLDYEIVSADEAFERLWDLCVTRGYEELRDEAKKDAQGRVTRAEIIWDREGHKQSKSLPNTLLGTLRIRDRRMTVEVNSAERSRTIQEEITTRLGEGARLRADTIQSTASMLEQMRQQGPPSGKATREHDELMQEPEVQKQILDMLAAHWESWIHESLPALGGMTPKEAVKTPDGREAVEALVLEMERDRCSDPLTAETNRKGMQRVRELLGL
ncbi:MAG: SEC-C metal-binding domain-containing protein [Desulfobacteraceae bacterium]